MLKTTQCADSPHAFHINNIEQTACIRVAKNCALHVCRFKLPSLVENSPARGDGALRDVERVVVVFGEAQHDGYLVLLCPCANHPHFGGVV